MRYVIGIDEVGRGPLAGPVVVAAVLIPRAWLPAEDGKRSVLRDSKQLTAEQRRLWSEYLVSCPEVKFEIVKIGARTIDAINITRAANRAARSACERLLHKGGIDPSLCSVYLDGGLYLSEAKTPRRRSLVHTEEVIIAKGRLIAQTLVKGDELLPAVRMASIIAKVHRDALMRRAAGLYPGYGFDEHKGYATKRHYAALDRLGPSKIHRRTYLGNRR